MSGLEKLAYGVNEVGQATGLSPWTIRAYIRQGKIRPTRIGTRVLIEADELRRFLRKGRQPLREPEPASTAKG